MSDFQTDFDSLSWKELAVILSRYLSSALVSHQTEMSDETMHEALGCCHQVTNRVIAERAAPDEDVRAAVDEPVAEVSSKFGDPEAFGERELVALIDIQSLPYGTKLYRLNQQRPVVLPERRGVDPYTAKTVLQWHKDREWNACIDEAERLNK